MSRQLDSQLSVYLALTWLQNNLYSVGLQVLVPQMLEGSVFYAGVI